MKTSLKKGGGREKLSLGLEMIFLGTKATSVERAANLFNGKKTNMEKKSPN